MHLISNKELKRGYAALDAVIQGPSFGTLSSDDRYRALSAAGGVAAELEHTKEGYAYSLLASDMPQATADDWELRLDGANQLKLTVDVIHSLTALARRWPDRLADYKDEFIYRTIWNAKEQPENSAQLLELTRTLFDVKWKSDQLVEPSRIWRDLTLALIEKGRVDAAIEVTERITDPYDVIAMRIDNRFISVVRARPENFNVDGATARRIKELEAAADALPKKLSWRRYVAELLRQQGHYSAALGALDSLISEVASVADAKGYYEDYDDEWVWVLNDRAIALERLGRWEEAEHQYLQAGLLRERGGTNVSQRINLAQTYCSWGQPEKALKSLEPIEAGSTSPYGSMQIYIVRLVAGLQLSNQKMADAALAAMALHRKDSESTYERALLETNHLDEAAALLIARLADRKSRQDALLGIQHYAQWAAPEHTKELDARWRSVIERPSVAASIAKVGSLETYRLENALDY